jgi:hypothetical protein
MIRDIVIEKENHFASFLLFHRRNQKQAARLNKSVIFNADRKSHER